MAEGWIKLYRNIQEHWIWQDSQKLKWWLDILLLANHKENKFLLGNDLIKIERGEHHTSELKLAERWGVSKTTVRKFLELLESDHMIELKKSKKGTTVKITNYNDYQDFSEVEKTIKKPQKNHNVDHKKTIKEPYAIPQKNHMVYTNNNEKNDNNEKNEEEGKEREKVPKLEHLIFPTPIHKKIYELVGDVGYRTWFIDTDITETDSTVSIKVPQEFKRNIIISKYIPRLKLGKRIEVS